MTDVAIAPLLSQPAKAHPVTSERLPIRLILIGVCVVFLVLFVLMPLIVVFVEALRSGIAHYVTSITDPDALAAANDFPADDLHACLRMCVVEYAPCRAARHTLLFGISKNGSAPLNPWMDRERACRVAGL